MRQLFFDASGMGIKMEIRSIYRDEWTEAMGIAWRTFLKFEACDYSPEGVKNFYLFVTDEMLHRMFLMGAYEVYGAFDENGKMVGMLGLRNKSHISLLFVEEAYHRQGIARSLIKYVFEYLLSEVGSITTVTVNSSPYAVGFYHKMGFQDMQPEMTKDGIRYTPMSFVI